MTKTFNHAALRRLIDEAPSKLKDAYDNQNGIQPEIFDTDRCYITTLVVMRGSLDCFGLFWFLFLEGNLGKK